MVVRYGEPVDQEYVDLWVVRIDDSGRAVHFEEWPFWPGKPYTAHARTEPVVLHSSSVDADRYAEWVRSQRLSARRLPVCRPARSMARHRTPRTRCTSSRAALRRSTSKVS